MLPQGYSHFHFIITTLFISSRRRFSHRLFTITHSTLNAFFISSPIQPYRRCLWMAYRQRVSLRRIYIPCVTQLCVYMHMCMYIYIYIAAYRCIYMYRYVVCMYLQYACIYQFYFYQKLTNFTTTFFTNTIFFNQYFQLVYILYIHTCVHAYIFLMCASVCLHVCTYVYTCNYTYVCVCVYTFMHPNAAEFASYLLICTTRSCYQSDTRTYKSK